MWKTLSKLVPALCLALVLAVPVSAQDSPFDGQWSADVPLPGGGAPVRFTLLLMADGDELRGTLQIGDARPVPIEEGRIRAGIVSFQRSLGDDGGSSGSSAASWTTGCMSGSCSGLPTARRRRPVVHRG